MKITLHNIIRWEYLRGKSFFLLDKSDEEDLLHFLYVLTENGLPYKEWVVSEDIARFVSSNEAKLRRSLEAWGQYTPLSSSQEGEEEGQAPEKVGDIVADLIVQGVSADWLMGMATFADVLLLRNAYERKQRYDLEDKRLWAFLLISPHINSKKIKRPEDLLPFAWDKTRPEAIALTEEDIKKRAEEIRKAYYG